MSVTNISQNAYRDITITDGRAIYRECFKYAAIVNFITKSELYQYFNRATKKRNYSQDLKNTLAETLIAEIEVGNSVWVKRKGTFYQVKVT